MLSNIKHLVLPLKGPKPDDYWLAYSTGGKRGGRAPPQEYDEGRKEKRKEIARHGRERQGGCPPATPPPGRTLSDPLLH
eukprot:9002423-Pyramimonas_sp.AAC.1